MQLPQPYGECNDKNPVPVSQCILECKRKGTMEHCGCNDFYMQSHKIESGWSQQQKILMVLFKMQANLFALELHFFLSDSCNISHSFFCAQPYIGKREENLLVLFSLFVWVNESTAKNWTPTSISDEIFDEEIQCDCLVPCKQIFYEPALSYAELVSENLETYVSSQDGVFETIQVFHHFHFPSFYLSHW